MSGAAISGQGQPLVAMQLQDFIFARELSEVYLLFDHISGQSAKTLEIIGAKPLLQVTAQPPGSADLSWIADVCLIGWPPTGRTAIERAEQAAILLLAKDRLNGAAAPANGASIAFTLLVAGGENERNQPAGPALPGDGGWGNPPPTRYTLAAFAYPGLIRTARNFRRKMWAIIVLLAVWLLLTCVLSWNIAAGHAILSRLDALAAARAAIAAKIDAADQEEARRAPGRPDAGVAPAVVKPYCERHRLSGEDSGAGSAHQYDSVAALRLCEPATSNDLAYRVTYADLADWIEIWAWVKLLPHHFCGGDCLATGEHEPPLTRNATDEQWASILAEVLANAALPVFYGILGAGAAVVRNMWAKMQDSLLSPRDITLALGQLALGAVVGACIGLFVTPNGTPNGGPALTGAVSLSASALSFIAGFGVEAVFVALESLIKRVFNAPTAGK
jgi:hypothetical protein